MTQIRAIQIPDPTAEVRDARMWVSEDGGATWTPHDGSGGGGGVSATIGADVPTDATPIAIKDSNGKLAYIQLTADGKLPVSVSGAGSGGTSSVDGDAFAADTTAGTPVVGAVDDGSPTTVADGDLGVARITPKRGLHVNLRSAGGTEIVPATSGKQDTGNTSLGNIDTNAGATTDSAVTGDNDGTLSAKIRGLAKMLADMWDSGNHRLNVFLQNTTIAVTQSGSWTVNASGAASTPTLTNVTESASTKTVLALNANRLGWTIVNDSDAAVNLKFGASASATSYTVRVLPRGRISHSDFGGAIYTGLIAGIWDTAPGTSGHDSARVTELTA